MHKIIVIFPHMNFHFLIQFKQIKQTSRIPACDLNFSHDGGENWVQTAKNGAAHAFSPKSLFRKYVRKIGTDWIIGYM